MGSASSSPRSSSSTSPAATPIHSTSQPPKSPSKEEIMPLTALPTQATSRPSFSSNRTSTMGTVPSPARPTRSSFDLLSTTEYRSSDLSLQMSLMLSPIATLKMTQHPHPSLMESLRMVVWMC